MENNINKIKPAIYHLLDGALNEESGYQSELVLKYLNDSHEIKLGEFINDIKIFDTNYYEDFSKPTTKLLDMNFSILPMNNDEHATSVLIQKINDKVYLTSFN